MRRLPALPTLLTCVLLASSAAGLAALPSLEADELATAEGLTLVAFDQDNACPTNPWSEPVLQSVSALGGRAVKVPRNTETVKVVLGEDAFRAKGMSVAWKDGQRLDVICGCPDADDLQAWAAAVSEGRSWADLGRDRLRDGEDKVDVNGHLEVSQREMCAGDLVAAFDELEVLWTRLPEVLPEERVLRFNHVGRNMAVLARKSDAVEARVKAMRDAVDPNAGYSELDEWIALNRILLDDAATIAWFDDSRANKDRAVLVEHAAPAVFGMLTDAGRWADAGTLIGDDPLDWLAVRKEQAGGLDFALSDHVALLAAGRLSDAKRYGLAVLKAMPDDPNTACKLLQRSVDKGFTHKSQAAIARKCDNPVVYETWEKSL